MKRREFLKIGTSGLIGYGISGSLTQLLSAHHALARVDKSPILVNVFLRGAADGLSLLIPDTKQDYELLAKQRPTTFIPRTKSLPLAGKNFRIHPALATLHQLFHQGKVTFFHGSGSTNNTRSHFVQQDLIDSGTISRPVSSGYLNRAMTKLHESMEAMALSVGEKSGLNLRGPYPSFAVADIKSYYKLDTADRSAGIPLDQRLRHLYGEAVPLSQFSLTIGAKTAGSLAALDKFAEMASQVKGVSPAAAYGASNTGKLFRAAAEIITTGQDVRVLTIDLEGWDTHSDQVSRLNQLLKDLDLALNGFRADILNRSEGSRVIMTIQTEFGRAVKQNGAAGTDHGRGGVMAVIAPAHQIQQKKILAPDFDLARLEDMRDVRVTVDQRQVMAEILVKHLGLRASDLGEVFLDGFTYKPFGILS